MKKSLFILLCITSSIGFSQEGEDHPVPDSSLLVSFPWYANNQYLIDYITQRGFYENNWGQGGSNARTDCQTARYRIPTKIHVYRDNFGTPDTNLLLNEVETIFEDANELFVLTGIQFYLIPNGIVFKSNENRRTGVDDFFDALDLFEDEDEDGVMNIHIIWESDFNESGYAISPYFNKYSIHQNITVDAIWNCYVTGNRDEDQIVVTLAHELGHALGLIHTHHPGRQNLQALLFDKENAKVANDCYQEMRSRTRQNKWYHTPPCPFTHNKKNCEINGDLLCDTAGDPGMGRKFSGTTLIKGVNKNSCTYQVNPSFDSDYIRDNDHHEWTPPTSNIMSYSYFACQDYFTPMQVGQMWYFIEQAFPWEHESIVSNITSAVCTSGGTYTLTNPPSGVGGLTWSVETAALFHPSTRTGSGASAFLKAVNSSVTGWATIEWVSASDCNYFNTSVDVWVGKPFIGPEILFSNDPYGDVGYLCSSHFGNTYSFQTSHEINTHQYRLKTLSGTILYTSSTRTGTTGTANYTPSAGWYIFEVRATNSCGTSPWIGHEVEYVDCNIGGGGDQGEYGEFSMMYPNPTSETLVIEEIEVVNSDKVKNREQNRNDSEPFEITILDSEQKLHYRETCDSKRMTIDVSQWEKGTYYVKIKKGRKTRTNQLIVK